MLATETGLTPAQRPFLWISLSALYLLIKAIRSVFLLANVI
jgi:hypothetical protein